MNQTEKIRENRLRLAAKRQGLLLQRSRSRDPRALGFGGYMLVDAQTNAMILGGGAFPYSSDLNEIEEWLLRPSDD